MSSKTRKVYFRLTEDEFQALEAVCDNYGIASVSELTRAALDNLIGMSDSGESLEDQISRLRSRLALLMAETEIAAMGVPLVPAIQPSKATRPVVLSLIGRTAEAKGKNRVKRVCLPRPLRSNLRVG